MNALNMASYWMPFTPNRYFRQHPKMLVGAEGAYYTTADGRRLFDTLSGLWCSPLGHAHPAIVAAFREQAAILDYAPGFQLGHPGAFRLAEKIADLAPERLNHVFFANSGSEAVESALKIALAYHRARGEAGRYRLIGRERGYHGVNLGGTSVGGMVANRRAFSGAMLPGVDHLPHPWNPRHMAFSHGQPAWGAHLADELERLVALHDAGSIAAVIVEPVQGSTGVLVPPVGYLQKLREICTRHGILLIFDEVITGFGRTGSVFGAQHFGVEPDMITFAKAVTNGVIPLGGVIASDAVRAAIEEAAPVSHVPELFHGYTYSGHPMACAVGLAALAAMASEGLVQRAAELAPVLQAAVHSLKDEADVTDIRNLGMAAAVDLKPYPGQPGLRAFRVFEHGFSRRHLFRVTGDTVSLAPPFIATPDEIAAMTDGLRQAIRDTAQV